MFNLLKKSAQLLNKKFSQNEQLRIDAENEYLAMSCGSFNPNLLAKIKRTKANNSH